MSTRKNSTTFPWFILVVLAILAVGSGGAFRSVAVVIGIVVVFTWLRNVSTAAGRTAGQPAPGTGFVGRREAPDLPPEVAERFQRLAAEMVVPGGRSMDEVMREAAEVYAQLPPHLREEIARAAPDVEPGIHVEVSGPLGNVLSRAMGIKARAAQDPAAPTPSAPPSAPAAASTPTAPPVPTAPAAPAALAAPAAPPVPPEAVPAAPPVAPVTITPAAITPAPITLAPITLAPITPSAPVGAPAGRPDQDVRSGATAPDVLTGAEGLPPGSLAEGWYVTADGRRERWWNGASWTAHVRERGAEV
ncbi:DUF2510 domain-containing protein [Nocardioides sp. J2M5]|uniref:DUF2510 domain-containing protein n=1 Tax=Nocardioides palaemonis TaxID=2829810 RepID=UPI001BA4A9E9|nr:DUF2510 domain-containing protein [Nocardioides palaemonis]MBS2940374.1 DUF2510 domain-containing protein [Nocardioides palaemonis]